MAAVLKHCKTCGRDFVKESDFLVKTSRWRICEDKHLWFNCECNSTLVIMNGKYDWYKPDMTMNDKAKSVFNQLPELDDLPHIPNSVMKLQQMLQDENTSAKDLASVAKKEPLIAANILQVANNLKTGGGSKIESLAHAITYVGIMTMKDIVLTASIKAMSFKSKSFDADEFWEQSFLTGKIAEALAKKYNKDILSDEAYLAGTLCNIGKVVVAICFPESGDRIFDEMENSASNGTWEEKEKELGLGYDHRVLGEIGACLWGLPEYIIDVASSHHAEPDANKPFPPDLAEIVKFANQLSHWIMLQPTRMNDRHVASLAKIFKLSDDQLEDFVEELSSQLDAA